MQGGLTDALLAELAVEPGLFHRGPDDEALWRGITEEPLRALSESLAEGDRTLETGCGGTTVVFAAAGARHTAITPSADEEARVRSLCERTGISVGSVDFRVGSSDIELPGWDEPLDAVLLDGAHRFPFPMIDWHYSAPMLRVGGHLWLDDIAIPAVYRLFEFLEGEPDWTLVAIHADKVAQFQKVAEPPVDDTLDWESQRYNEPWRWVFSYIPLSRRWRKLRQRTMLRSRLRARRSR